MAMQVHPASALGAGGVLPAESAAGRTFTTSSSSSSSSSPSLASSSCSCSALSKSGRRFGGRRDCAIGEARTRACKRGGGSFVVRASSGGPSGKDESKAVYDAFFLGKALAEAVSERVGSAIGEFLSDVGRRQAEQQKQIREFQDEVQERAAAAALKAAQKALAIEKEKDNTPKAPPPASPSPAQPPPSTSGLSNPDDAPTSISIED
ncbi:unnamed protein product [Calypogeia fissa]